MSAHKLLTVDCGLRGCGVAHWEYDRLVKAHYVPNPQKTGGGVQAWARMATAVRGTILYRCHVVIETQWHRQGEGSLKVNQLMELQAMAGMVFAACAEYAEAGMINYLPHQWTKGTPYDKREPRIISRLDRQELKAVVLPGKTLAHNVWDAVGIGLYHLGRLDKERVIAR